MRRLMGDSGVEGLWSLRAALACSADSSASMFSWLGMPYLAMACL